MQVEHEIVIVGGGPAGSTAATILAQSGRDVVVVEKAEFPRFHIGESLLPASVGIFERLGVHQRIRDAFIAKPGGKWLYGPIEVPGDFSQSDRKAHFKEHPYSYLVERSEFDPMLIQRSAECGAEVHFGCEVKEVPTQDGRVTGVRCVDASGNELQIHSKLVIDATGLSALIPSKFRLREISKPQRMGIYTQYSAKPARADAGEGWFLGQMFFDGWTWLIRLPHDRFSVGVVLTVDRFRNSRLSPTQLLEKLVEENELLKNGMSQDRRRISEVNVTGNMGSTSKELAGAGWVAVGDSAYFIDPCYSSGVHLAMKSAEMVADLILEQPAGVDISPQKFDRYQSEMRTHEKSVHRMVDAFYIASRHTSVQKLITAVQGGYFTRKFITFVGGDFLENSGFIRRLQLISRCVGSIFGNNAGKSPENSPDYLEDAAAYVLESPLKDNHEAPSIRKKAA